MGYEARMDAAAEYAAEVAHEAFQDGDFDDDIKRMILEGEFDEEVKQRMKMLLKKCPLFKIVIAEIHCERCPANSGCEIYDEVYGEK